MENNLIIEKIHKLQLTVRGKNSAASRALENAIIPLIEYDQPLKSISRKALLEMKGVGESTADLIMKIINGECVHSVAKAVPKVKLGASRWKSASFHYWNDQDL